ncbi:hypothetical protein GCM10011352_34310 [Marinobacterium zhoushanense]|uniref:Uncharacterized protein n=1 Tax=Marinobacterium zhoushanense TaxID=1679163 RepID=A0ABQ1KSG4_9GAMM|nr:hypothetical protein [Marinobacterium zhoushanense]GGC05276.1 hypothetical protein GCM10011352_34310 [Marinobacterium zhoushanense]
MRIREWLHTRADSPRQNFTLLLSGFSLFTLGLALVGAGQYLFPPGLNAELIALGGLILIGGGIILASFGYLSLSVLRILSFLDKKHE